MLRNGTVLLLASAAAGQLTAQGTTPKAKPESYPAHAAAGSTTLGAEYLVHSFSGQGGTFLARDYLVIEVALYPAAGEALDVNAGNFTLALNGKKRAMLPQSPAMVAASLKYPDWEMRPGMEADAGVGNAGVILGRPPATERFPGDPRAGKQRLPRPPQAPEPENRSGLDRPEPAKAEDVAVNAALPEGTARGPVSGYLYYAFKGKASGIRSLVLMYKGVMLKLL